MQFSTETKTAESVLESSSRIHESGDKLPFRWGGGVAGGLATARRRASDGHGSARQGWKGSKLLAVSRCNWGLRVCIAVVTAASENRWWWISGARGRPKIDEPGSAVIELLCLRGCNLDPWPWGWGIGVIGMSEDEVSKIVKSCDTHKVPIVPYGGATSLEGHILSPNGGVCIDMSMMNSIKALHIEDMDVVVEPGIGWMELNEYLEPYGLFFPLDPGPGATIGGMCATRCSGSLAVRYGTMRDNVISLKVVLANGDIIKTASRARKSAAGYDLTRLVIGSEGTLGVITEVTLRLQKIPQHSVVAMCNFPSIKDAADVAIATMKSGIQVSRVELMDEVQVKAINIANGKDLPEIPTLMFEFIGTEAYAREQTQIVQKIAAEHNGSDFVFAEDPEAKKELWKLRKEALWACFAMKPNFEAMCTDVCVPLSHLAELISRSKQELDASPLICASLAHAGDGNFHTNILFDPNIEEHRREAERLNKFMVLTALSMEGTCTGEHGVGTGKVKYLEKELGVEALRTMKRIKATLDPNNIMNPGKIIPPHICF
uniref:D-lactate dehydrogenase (cytochrome) n=1 Tax=Quercus lobata TaxID=97700 RepID=A0A7N2M4P0_QUELO